MLVNWGEFTKGEHRLKVFIDGLEKSNTLFETSGLDNAFVRGLSDTRILQDFPAQGESTTVQWNEAGQNFIVIDQN